RLLISVVKISLSCEIGQPPHRNQPGFHPTPICKRYVVGIPAELAKISKFSLFLLLSSLCLLPSAFCLLPSAFVKKICFFADRVLH
ncbi:MAG: hypothetical protein ACRC62_03070, partial [Microcoleus sp.]